MTDWLARFRELTADDPRFSHGDNSDVSDNRPTSDYKAQNRRDALAIVTNVPFVTASEEADMPNAGPNQTVEFDWRDLFEERTAIRQFDGGYSRVKAERLAWAELQNRWHMAHGERVPPDLCAGCRRPIGGAPTLDLIDGCRVHSADSDCLIRHGERWRMTATRALLALGLRPR